MKWNIILAGLLFAGGLAFSPEQADLRGSWQLKNADPCHMLVVRIEMGEGIWKGRADQPALNSFNAEVRSIRLEKDTIVISIDDRTEIRTVKKEDKEMTGYLKRDGKQLQITLEKH